MSYIDSHLTPDASDLGRKAQYESEYNPKKLFPITRTTKRAEIGIQYLLPFYGVDLWNHYEVSWLNQKGKPIVAVAEIMYDCRSPNIIESKSMKLYFNSFNNSRFASTDEVKQIMEKDLSQNVGSQVTVNLKVLGEIANEPFSVRLQGIYIDELDVVCNEYKVNPALLTVEDDIVEETLCTDLLKSNCLVTNQPDWCSVQITYKGRKINRENLLKYIVSFRNCNEFHEQCIEKIFVQIMQYCRPESLTVYGRSTRRGGLDINAFRSTEETAALPNNTRLCRQ